LVAFLAKNLVQTFKFFLVFGANND
jgi:hypothetical protein